MQLPIYVRLGLFAIAAGSLPSGSTAEGCVGVCGPTTDWPGRSGTCQTSEGQHSIYYWYNVVSSEATVNDCEAHCVATAGCTAFAYSAGYADECRLYGPDFTYTTTMAMVGDHPVLGNKNGYEYRWRFWGVKTQSSGYGGEVLATGSGTGSFICYAPAAEAKKVPEVLVEREFYFKDVGAGYCIDNVSATPNFASGTTGTHTAASCSSQCGEGGKSPQTDGVWCEAYALNIDPTYAPTGACMLYGSTMQAGDTPKKNYYNPNNFAFQAGLGGAITTGEGVPRAGFNCFTKVDCSTIDVSGVPSVSSCLTCTGSTAAACVTADCVNGSHSYVAGGECKMATTQPVVGGCGGTRFGCCEGSKESAADADGSNCVKEDNSKNDVVGGCGGTRFGCCEGSKKVAQDADGTNCTPIVGATSDNTTVTADDNTTATADDNMSGLVVAATATVTTTVAIEAGATTFALADVSGITAGDSLTIGSGATEETAVVASVTADEPAARSRRAAPTPGTVTLAAPLANTHAAGTSITWTPAVVVDVIDGDASSAVIKSVGVGIFAVVATLF